MGAEQSMTDWSAELQFGAMVVLFALLNEPTSAAALKQIEELIYDVLEALTILSLKLCHQRRLN